MKQFIIISGLLSSLIFSAKGQINTFTFKPESRTLIDSLFYGLYPASESSEVGRRFEAFRNNLNKDELIQLTNSPNPSLRANSFLALALNNVNNFEIVRAHLHDTTRIFVAYGCEGYRQTIGDLFYEIATSEYAYQEAFKLSSIEKLIIDSLLIFDPEIKLVAKSDLLKEIKPIDSYYPRIKEIAEIESNNSSVVALSRFQKQEDTGLIINLLENSETDIQYLGLRAARIFPHHAFFPFIEKIHQKEIKKTRGLDYSQIRMLYQAIVQYKNIQSKNLLKKTFAKSKDFWVLKTHSEYIWLALFKFPDPLYDEIQKQLRLDNYEIRHLKYFKNVEN